MWYNGSCDRFYIKCYFSCYQMKEKILGPAFKTRLWFQYVNFEKNKMKCKLTSKTVGKRIYKCEIRV